MAKGILIAVEGLDGSGKSTQAHLLVEWLRSLGAPVHHTCLLYTSDAADEE